MEEIFSVARRKFSKPFFMEVVILATWHIWKQRNEAIFQRVIPSFKGWKRRFTHEASMHVHRVRDKHVECFAQWIDSLV